MTLSIKHSAKVVLAISAVALGLALAACGGNEDESSADASASASGAGSGTVAVQSVDGTNVLADPEGRTLYTAAVERGGRILCTDACTSFWEPELASAKQAKSASSDLGADLGVVDRPDGKQQLTLEGMPLYSFTEEDPGQLEGDGFMDDFDGTHFEWQVAQVGGAAGSSGSESPSDSSGNSLY